jgi:phosphatidate cytidylyltransferase
MLKQRVITAIVLLAVLLPALFYPSPEPFCAVTLVLIVGAGWGARARASGAARGVYPPAKGVCGEFITKPNNKNKKKPC